MIEFIRFANFVFELFWFLARYSFVDFGVFGFIIRRRAGWFGICRIAGAGGDVSGLDRSGSGLGQVRSSSPSSSSSSSSNLADLSCIYLQQIWDLANQILIWFDLTILFWDWSGLSGSPSRRQGRRTRQVVPVWTFEIWKRAVLIWLLFVDFIAVAWYFDFWRINCRFGWLADWIDWLVGSSGTRSGQGRQTILKRIIGFSKHWILPIGELSVQNSRLTGSGCQVPSVRLVSGQGSGSGQAGQGQGQGPALSALWVRTGLSGLGWRLSGPASSSCWLTRRIGFWFGLLFGEFIIYLLYIWTNLNLSIWYY